MQNREMDHDIRSQLKSLAAVAHWDQTDKSGEAYYSAHLEKVSLMAVGLMGFRPGTHESFYVESLGICHDIIEDTEITNRDLLDVGASNIFIKDLGILTHEPDFYTYSEYIQNICKNGSLEVVCVKLADNLINTSTLYRLDQPTADRLYKKYNKVRPQLTEAWAKRLNERQV